MSRLKELEKRLKSEPDNLGLRVMVAGAMREAGRSTEAVELYRSVALAYRDQGRQQQAIAVCRSILEIAPDDSGCQALLGTLTPAQQPARRSSIEETPLPRAVPYHVADPTSAAARVPQQDIDSDELPAVEGARTRPGALDRPSLTGLAEAARQISGLISNEHVDVSEELDTRKVTKIDTGQLRKIAGPPPAFDTGRHASHDIHEIVTPIPGDVTDQHDALTPVPADSEDEMTQPRELPRGTTKR
ncbi:MAG: putative transcriptional regulator, Crp/Fnr family [Myxococcales bacterium]|nr:putative transcriptional regulator, Crp/Fnr family [Myxococcales bacterium]